MFPVVKQFLFLFKRFSGCYFMPFDLQSYGYDWKSPWKHTLPFYFTPKLLSQGLREARGFSVEFLTFRYTNSDKRCMASCPAELETVYLTFLYLSTCLPVVSSIFDGNKSTPSLFFSFLSSKDNWFHFSRPKHIGNRYIGDSSESWCRENRYSSFVYSHALETTRNLPKSLDNAWKRSCRTFVLFFCFISSMMDGGWMIVVMGVEIVCVHLITFTFYNCLILLSIAEECFLYSGCATQSIGWRNPDFWLPY